MNAKTKERIANALEKIAEVNERRDLEGLDAIRICRLIAKEVQASNSGDMAIEGICNHLASGGYL